MSARRTDTLWDVALVIGLVAALIVAVLLLVLIRPCATSTRSVDEPARRRRQGRRATPPTSRSSQATAPVLGLIVDEAVVQDGYMNALTDGYGGAA